MINMILITYKKKKKNLTASYSDLLLVAGVTHF